jgi:hypothetical protein
MHAETKEEKRHVTERRGGADDDPVATMPLRSTDRLESFRRLHAETEMLFDPLLFFYSEKLETQCSCRLDL